MASRHNFQPKLFERQQNFQDTLIQSLVFVDQKMIDQAQNSNLIFLHCLPAFHDRKTKIGEEIFNQYGISEMEVTNEVFEGSHSKVFDQAENRLHTIKAVMLATLS